MSTTCCCLTEKTSRCSLICRVKPEVATRRRFNWRLVFDLNRLRKRLRSVSIGASYETMWRLFRIPLTFGGVIQEAGNSLATLVRSYNTDETERLQLEESYDRSAAPNSDVQHLDYQSASGLVSESVTGNDRLAGPRLSPCPGVDSVRYNGSLASVQMFLILLAVSTSTTLAALVSRDFNPLIGMLTLITYMLIGLLVMTMFLSFWSRLAVRRANGEDPKDPERRDSLTLIGIVIFYLFVCVLEMFHITAALSCREVWISCSNPSVVFNFVVEVFFHVARIVYLGLQTTFCFAFHSSTFKNEVLTRFGLMFLQTVNISLWFDALIQESSELSGQDWRRVDAYNQECHPNASNVSTDVLECLAHNNTIYSQTERTVTPICLPFTIEFTLLVGELLGYCFYHCGDSQAERNRALTNGRAAILHQRADTSGIGGPDARGTLPDETTSLLPRTDDRSFSSGNLFVQLWTAFVIVINVLNCVLTFICKLQGTHATPYRNFAFYVLFTFWVGMAIAVATGYYVSRSFRVIGHRSSFSSTDYLMLFTSFGPIAYNAFTCIAACGHVAVASDNIYVTRSFYVTMQVFNAIQVHLQTTFSLYAARIAVEDTRRRTPEARAFKAIVLYLAVSNLSLWFTGTIGGYEFGGLQVGDDGLTLQAAYFGRGAWAIIYNIVVPLLLFYRFNSCLVFTRIYRRL